ncbi:MAG: UDP-N-acetylglucosamine--N-acetylmuramyl-(pentapeptide) pyrophosphoryl-undecaprenol N-acetylglucosamine transferase [Aminobacterium sp.]|jgi:UDP-N-acetylglucosamine--N-acetylmuramyl-(pentapeptide) pyrophosphoryl-undecaprenol N-acetylglucosamine transferase|uniref:UDP-N-acetylglucosamine--N-acetylmuramyl- (pentapeptide) pyrophosphoryl-undecaprenol N-acetylglucosamine transferase n=1 Tax=unclassified Aminobacterium TaxID=2685012 RepID=UPI001BCD9C63|nr:MULTISPECIES: UDP-N-acetylglucosamine--N-acetylmuramyl-(pentapeptide) pyrophosphoryl-undecaprenol N-acetylglucosamine transferase [unclassified Aminobacterium]MEA4876338.1 UDP-N-acetylglucosamine--N-acetylmuramyl-(pentapeptide) pyrophosphoryl-undecaprenol N-acetylglucosamine transferase [Aminobacterium sp.]WMI70427.1 UDP-N-acetylglucosamine--N-acetylmuramyl-(pentapeptide) pyrophosphoryl-undecaprenol N-acetylglucosamine transferase [Aminobacterium sp. MB27-C1]
MKKAVFVAGGTGGHIFPAVSLGNWMKENIDNPVDITYICGSRLLEREIYKGCGITPEILPVEGSPLGILKMRKIIHRTLSLFSAFFKMLRFLRKDRPDVCVLFGGYVSFPPMLACLLCKVPVIIHEQNSIAGKVTRIAKKLGIPILAGWTECYPLGKSKFNHVGIPIRRFKIVDREEAWSKLDTGVAFPKGPIVGVLSGSLTSTPLFQTICELAKESDLNDVTFLVVGGKGRCFGTDTIVAVERQWDMSIIYSVVDTVIARAGASTLAELMVLGVPSLIVPWRGASDGHQERNAALFEQMTGNIVWDEHASKHELKQHLIDCITKAHDCMRLNGRRPDSYESNSSKRIWDVLISLTRRESL